MIAGGKCRYAAPGFARILLISEQRLVAAAIERLLADPPLSAVVDIRPAPPPLEDVEGYDLVVCQVLEPAIRMHVRAAIPAMAGLAPIIALDNAGQEATLGDFLQRGASGVLTNDSSSAELLACIDETLRGSRWIGSTVQDWLIRSASAGGRVRGRHAHRLDETDVASTFYLTAAERRVLEAIASGMTPAQVASARSNSVHTVRNHLANAYRKLRVHSRTQAVLAVMLTDGRHTGGMNGDAPIL
ncbi:MAG TPA: LuxR C-terminal-related transcriptional regulator [Candidatus Dormibacteraeota bacterium]